MSHLSLHTRILWQRSLYMALFPLVFLMTVVELAPEHWREGAVKSVGFVVLMGLGLACAAATGGRL